MCSLSTPRGTLSQGSPRPASTGILLGTPRTGHPGSACTSLQGWVVPFPQRQSVHYSTAAWPVRRCGQALSYSQLRPVQDLCLLLGLHRHTEQHRGLRQPAPYSPPVPIKTHARTQQDCPMPLTAPGQTSAVRVGLSSAHSPSRSQGMNKAEQARHLPCLGPQPINTTLLVPLLVFLSP